MSFYRIKPITGTERERQYNEANATGDAVIGSQEIHTTSDELRLFMGHKLIGGPKYLGTVASEADMLDLVNVNGVGCRPGDFCLRSDVSAAAICLTNQGELVSDWYIWPVSISSWNDLQDVPPTLASIGGLVTAANSLIYFSDEGAALTELTAFARSLIGCADATEARGILDSLVSGPVGSSGLTQSTGRLLGRTTADTGAIEEIQAGASLSLNAGTLNTVQDIRISATPQFASALLWPSAGPTTGMMRIADTSQFAQFVFQNPDANYKGYLGYIGSTHWNTARQGCVELGSESGDVVLRPAETEALRATASLVTLGVPLKTPAPSGGTAGEWKLGTYSSGYVRIDIGGTPYDLSTSASGVPSGAITASGLTMATARLLGRTSASTGAIEELDAAGARTLLGLATTDTPTFGGATFIASSGATLARFRINADTTLGQFLFESVSGLYQGYIGMIGPSAGLGTRDGTIEFGSRAWDIVFRPGEAEALRLTSSGMKTANPSGGTAQPWKLGSYVAGAPTATGYAQIEINGTAYKVLVST